MQRSKLVLGFVVALGVGGLGAAAVAMENDTGGAGSLADETTTTVVVDPSTTVPTTVAPTTTRAPVADPAASPSTTDDLDGTDPGVDRSTDGCDGGTYANHGQYVSSIAKGEDRQPGDVPAAAQSDCGKPLSSVGDDEGDGAEPPAASEPESGDDAGNPGNGNGNGNGQGQGQGNGKGASGK